jgi:hypothetical protein
MCGQALGSEGTGQGGGNAAIVAAGFGYQNGSDSSITVKVYDAVSGEVLSEEVYDLSVKEDQSVRSHSSEERIFAGGAWLGATDLSNFVLRVYDAKTGEFQWAGQLNLTPRDRPDGSEEGRMISTVVPRRAVVTKIHAVDVDAPQPLFVLRALDFSTGGIIWEDEFSPEGKGATLVKRTADHPADFGGMAPEAGIFDFRILMFDRSGGTVLWEAQVLQRQADEGNQGAIDDRAQMLPTWTGPMEQDPTPERI